MTDRVGLVDPVTGMWSLRGPGGVVNSFFYGNPGDVPFVGDWNCDGIDTPGLYRQSDGFVYLRNSNTQGIADIRFFFGNPGDFPLAGDFNNDGCDTVCIYRAPEARIYMINELGANDGGLGAADFTYIFGNPGDKPFVGDFNGDGVDTLGLHRESTGFVYFRQSHTQGIANSEFFFGDPGDRLVSGDWGIVDNVDTPAIFRPSLRPSSSGTATPRATPTRNCPFGLLQRCSLSAGAWEVKLGVGGSLAQGDRRDPATAQQLTPGGWLAALHHHQDLGPALGLGQQQWSRVSGIPDARLATSNLGVRVTDSSGQVGRSRHCRVTITDGCHANGSLPAAQCLALVELYRSYRRARSGLNTGQLVRH